MNKFDVRRAKSTDSEAIARIAAETFPLACPPNSSPRELACYIRDNLSSARFRQMIADEHTVVYVARHENKTCGFLTVRFSTDHAVDLDKLYVDPIYHGSGVAARLFDQTVECARENGYGSIRLSVSKANSRGIAFYRKAGFAIVGETEFQVGTELHEDYLMRYDLDVPSVDR